MKTGNRIVEVLSEQSTPTSFNELRSRLGISYDSLRGAINRLLKAKLIQTSGNNIYTLPTMTGQPVFDSTSKCIYPGCSICHPVKVPPVKPVSPVRPKLNRIMLVLDDILFKLEELLNDV